ncbi:Cullin-associated NEDD8-dissociated protein 1 [Nowakowskiella sp. JEL0078]|nr:Cullin-associated NEDD8-dissociated protein 1 [Nowakowskiella sp. JEL0078]
MEGDEEDTEEEFDDDYFEDEDVSWKVRRASSKLLGSIISTQSELLEVLYQKVAPVLITRFKEREETVRVEILNTFNILVKQTGFVPESTTYGQNARNSLRQLLPKFSKALSKELNKKSILTKQAGFPILKEIILVLNGELENSLSLFIPSFETSLSTAGSSKALTNTNLKIDTLTLLRVVFMAHSPESLHQFVDRLIPPIVTASNDKFYKITSEALVVFIEIIRVIRPISWNSETSKNDIQPFNPIFEKSLEQIYTSILGRLKTSDVDLEVKECALTSLGRLLVQCGDLLPSDKVQNEVFPLLLERLRNELTRLTSVRVFNAIASSPLFDNQSQNCNISLIPILEDLISELASFLRKSQRQLRITSLQCLETLVKFFGSSISLVSYSAIFTDVKPLLLESDMHSLPLAFSVLCAVIGAQADASIIANIHEDIVPHAITLVLEMPHVVGGGYGLEALLNFWKTLANVEGSKVSEIIEKLTLPIISSNQVNIPKQAFSTISQSVAVLTLSSPLKDTTLNVFISHVESPTTTEKTKYLSLLIIGEIGRKMDLSLSHPNLHINLLNLFVSTSEEIKHAAAFSLGNITLGNLNYYMPIILSIIREGGQKRYLVLIALKEIITRYSLDSDKSNEAKLNTFAPELWQLLFSNVESNDATEESTRNVISECLGKLSLTEPSKFLNELQLKLNSPSAVTRMTVITAIRFTFTDLDNESYDSFLRPLIVDFLKLVKDDDVNVRRVSLQTLNSAAHNKPNLIRESLYQLLPLVYEETIVKDELIRVVEMGPFKHRVDDGLEERKSAFECMYTLLETSLPQIEISAFFQRVLAGLSDATHEIKVLAHLMLQRLSQLAPTAIAPKLDETMEPLRVAISTKPKANAVKQELEKNAEMIRSAVRTVIVLSKISDAVVSPKFEDMNKELRGPNSGIQDVVQQVIHEVEQQQQLSTFPIVTGAGHGKFVASSSIGLAGSLWPVRSVLMNGAKSSDDAMDLSF